MKKELLQAIANLFLCFLGGFATTGVAYFASDGFSFIQAHAALLMFASAVVGVVIGAILDRLFKDNSPVVDNPFVYVFLTGAIATIGFAVGTLVLMLLGAK